MNIFFQMFSLLKFVDPYQRPSTMQELKLNISDQVIQVKDVLNCKDHHKCKIYNR